MLQLEIPTRERILSIVSTVDYYTDREHLVVFVVEELYSVSAVDYYTDGEHLVVFVVEELYSVSAAEER